MPKDLTNGKNANTGLTFSVFPGIPAFQHLVKLQFMDTSSHKNLLTVLLTVDVFVGYIRSLILIFTFVLIF